MLKTIKINNLEPEKTVNEDNSPLPYDKIWLDKLTNGPNRKSSNDYKIQYALTNGSASTYSQNAILDAFLLAYNRHEDILLSPDDLWLMITINFSKYINTNSEQLRHLFVDHEGKKKLVVTEPLGKREEDWTDFFEMMQTQISKNIKTSEIVDNLINNFSTTTEIELILSYACVMDTLKTYFQYSRCIPSCGILNNDSFSKYIQDLLPILNEFIKTYEGKVDVEFWNHIADSKRGRLGSGSTEYISGWILKLFYEINGKNPEQIMAADIKLDSIHVPVEVENHCTCLKKTCYVLGGFYGVDSTQDHIHKPVMSLAVIEDLTTVEKL
ncbi:unnamed protein product [Adineta steineri]|uniref:Uncharacterized protein n=1 Tax=Adineta steineri TaxID=433720 RepID=A0A813WIW4_9BILA|nr:unnamed protein product [Adineta steineri]